MPTLLSTAPAATYMQQYTDYEYGQAVSALRRHESRPSGRCDGCGGEAPCAGRRWALRVLAERYVGLLR